MEKNKNNQKTCPTVFRKSELRRGFTLMVAMLVSSIVIVVGLGVSSIILRQFNLAILSRESQSAFYAADALVECIMYWDLKGKVFAPMDPSDPNPNGVVDPNKLVDLVCDNLGLPIVNDVYIDIARTVGEPGDGEEILPCAATEAGEGSRTSKTYQTSLLLQNSRGSTAPIAYATITKRRSCEVGDIYTVLTQIDSNGYNTSREGDLRRIERGLSLTY